MRIQIIDKAPSVTEHVMSLACTSSQGTARKPTMGGGYMFLSQTPKWGTQVLGDPPQNK